ncbi:MAG TPA: phage baseplate assembly protein V [Rhizobium sp.]|nr:phage baseplate assembly protein V [Rhizobium sp.]
MIEIREQTGDGRSYPQVTTAVVQPGGVVLLPAGEGILLRVQAMPDEFFADVRLLMPYVGKARGLTILPKAGDEVVAFFPGGNLSTGYAYWGAYNGVSTVPEGTAENLILFEGRDDEDVQVRIRGNVRIRIEKNEATQIDGTEDHKVLQGRSSEITVADLLKVIGRQETEVTEGRVDKVAGGETRTVEGGRTETIAGGMEQTISGGADQTTNGMRTDTVNGQHIDGVILGRNTVIGVGWTIEVIGPVAISCLGTFALLDSGDPVVVYDGEDVVFHKRAVFMEGTSGVTF